MICDSHVHFLSPGFFTGLGATEDAIGRLGWTYPRSADALAHQWVADLDGHGVSRAALIASLPGDAGSVATAIALHPSRFAGFFMLDPTREDALAYATRALDAGLRTVCLFPAMHRYALYDQRVARVFELVSSHASAKPTSPTSDASPTSAVGRESQELPKAATPSVFVHCGVLSVGVRKKLGLPSPFDIRFGNPLDLHGLALTFPSVPIVIPHFGAGMLREALMLADLCANVHLDTSSSNSWIKYAPGLTLEQVFQTALNVVGPDRLLFGTDSSYFPRGWNRNVYTQQKAALDAIGTSADVQNKIFGGNFARLF